MKKVIALFAFALASAALVACGGSGSTTTTETSGSGAGGGTAAAGGSTLRLIADPSGRPAFAAKEASTKAGKVTLELENASSMPHDLAIEDSSGKLVGKTAVITENMAKAVVDLKPGTYAFYCSVPGHRQAGMEGALTVT